MGIAVFTLTSPLHDARAVNEATADFLGGIRECLGRDFTVMGDDFSSYGQNDLDVIFVRTGGTEGIFRRVFEDVVRPVGRKVVLLAAGSANSLAASMEILSFINAHGCCGEIIHGDAVHVAGRIDVLVRVGAARKMLEGRRIGVIGRPSDWLISSTYDSAAVKQRLGLDIVEIPVRELLEIMDRQGSQAPEDDPMAAEVLREVMMSENGKVREYAAGAMRIYAALRELVAGYGLSGFTLRCFDLLDAVGNTGCLALALMNARGVPSGCEGDVPALLTMMVGNALTGQSGFQANPSSVNPVAGEITIAHCTVPFNMVGRRVFDTHFESGIGVAVHGELPLGKATLMKLSGDLSRCFCKGIIVVGNGYEPSLCRTQVRVLLDGDPEVAASVCRDYLLKAPIGNHHVLFTGEHEEVMGEFVAQMGGGGMAL